MKSFVQTSSIIRRAAVLGIALSLGFAADVWVSFRANDSMLKGLQSVYETNLVLEQVTQAQESLGASIETLRRLGDQGSASELVTGFQALHQHTLAAIREAAGIPGADAATRALIQASLGAVHGFEKAANEVLADPRRFAGENGRRELQKEWVVISQFELEARESLRKLQLHVNHRSDQLFASVYADRNRPLYAMVGLVAFLLGLMGVFGFLLFRSILLPLRSLLHATDVVADGRLDYRAPIVKRDEFGRLAHAFNRMVARLQESYEESQARARDEMLRFKFLSDSSEEIARHLGYEETLARISTAAVPFLADWCAVDVLERDGRIRRTAIAHSDPSKSEAVAALKRHVPPSVDSVGVVPEVLREGRSILTPHVTEEGIEQTARGSEHAQLLRSLGFRSGMCVPIRMRDNVIGAISLVSAREGRAYSEADLLLAEDFARRSAYALENAGLFREVQGAVRVRDEFLSIASHELKTPITPLKMQIQSLARVLDKEAIVPPERLRRAIDTCEKMIRRMTRLIDDLLDVSRINAGRLSLHLEEFDLTEVVKETLERFDEEFRKAGCAVSLASPERVIGRWDRSRMEQVVLNLVTNALRYGLGKPIEVGVAEDGEDILITVKDHGVGIAPEDHARIFKRFERAAADNQYGGLGLGLYIVSEILQLHGGQISVRSAVGQGSVFIVRVPRRVSGESAA